MLTYPCDTVIIDVQNTEVKNSLFIYPNPAGDILFIQSEAILNDATISVYNLMGPSCDGGSFTSY
jgi:hypothetical protein